MINVCVKICGITTLEDAEAATTAGADYLGFNFWPGSPRAIDIAAAARIAAALPAGVRRVGVFVNPRREEIERAMRGAGLDFVQFHGDEDAELVREYGTRAIKAFRLEAAPAPGFASGYGPLHAVLLDAPAAPAYAGRGQRLDWRAFGDAELPRPFWLAGGLTPENVGEAIRLARPDGVDVASGVEDAPGRKSARRIHEFLHAVREALA